MDKSGCPKRRPAALGGEQFLCDAHVHELPRNVRPPGTGPPNQTRLRLLLLLDLAEGAERAGAIELIRGDQAVQSVHGRTHLGFLAEPGGNKVSRNQAESQSAIQRRT
jgi:hypothetical protein